MSGPPFRRSNTQPRRPRYQQFGREYFAEELLQIQGTGEAYTFRRTPSKSLENVWERLGLESRGSFRVFSAFSFGAFSWLVFGCDNHTKKKH
jgi:hypothetical protein